MSCLIANFKKQFEYELWANKQTIEAIIAAIEPEESAFKLMGHIVSSHTIWLDKIKGIKSNIGSWEIIDLHKCLDLSTSNHQNWIKYLSKIEEKELGEIVSFTFTEHASSITIEDLIIHLINHSSYHRGQIIASLKGKLDPLPLTTYIAFSKKTT